MIHACGGQEFEYDDTAHAGSGGQSSSVADASPVGVGGSSPVKVGGAEHNPCTPMYCFQNGEKLMCLPTVCALLSPTQPSPVARAGQGEP